MPWQPAESEAKTRKANTPKKQRQWRDVANGVLAKTGNDARAIRTANGVIKKGAKGATRQRTKRSS